MTRTAEVKDYFRAYYLAHKAEINARTREYFKNNEKLQRLQIQAAHVRNRSSRLAYMREYAKTHAGKINAKNRRYQAAKAHATPPWITAGQLKEIELLYIVAKQLEQADGLKRHVDHIYPLRGKTCCGLHVPWNLRILCAADNRKKSNRIV